MIPKASLTLRARGKVCEPFFFPNLNTVIILKVFHWFDVHFEEHKERTFWWRAGFINKRWVHIRARPNFDLEPLINTFSRFNLFSRVNFRVRFYKFVLWNVHEANLLTQSQRSYMYVWLDFMYKVVSFMYSFSKQKLYLVRYNGYEIFYFFLLGWGFSYRCVHPMKTYDIF